MSKRPKILVTGGTGFLGQYVVPRLREFADVSVMSRSGKSEVTGDLEKWDAGLDIAVLKAEGFDIFLHMAGLYDLKASALDTFRQNVAATNMALKVSDQLGIPYFVNTSSIAAGVNSTLKVVKPYDLHFQNTFHDPYSESKAMAERMIQNWRGNHWLKINLRLGILVGDSKNGQIQRIDGPYHAARALEKIRPWLESIPGKLPLPGDAKVRLPLVPVDVAAKAIVQFCQRVLGSNETGYQSYHITPKEGLAVMDFYKSVLKARFIKSQGVNLISVLPQKVISKLSKMIVGFPEEQLRYVLKLPQYDSTDTQKVLGENWCPEFSQYEKAFWSGYEKYISNR